MSKERLDRRGRLEQGLLVRREPIRLERTRTAAARDRLKARIAERCGIADDRLLDELASLAVEEAAIPALALLPLAEIAWADGQVDTAERNAVLQAAERAGVLEEPAAARQLIAWLDHPPPAITFEVALSLIEQTCRSLDAATRDAVRDELLDRARTVATASGGLFGRGTVCPAEARVLERVQKVVR